MVSGKVVGKGEAGDEYGLLNRGEEDKNIDWVLYGSGVEGESKVIPESSGAFCLGQSKNTPDKTMMLVIAIMRESFNKGIDG